MPVHHYTAIIEREGDGFVSLCPELAVASQGNSIEDALANRIRSHPGDRLVHAGWISVVAAGRWEGTGNPRRAASRAAVR